MSVLINESNLPATINHTVYQGNDFAKTRLIREGGVAVDISADAFRMRIVDPKGGTLLNLTIGSGITLAPTGIYQYALTAAQVTALPVNCKLKWDLLWIRSNGVNKHLEAGYFKTVERITP